MKRELSFFLFIFLFCFLFPAGIKADDLKVGIIDLEKIVEMSGVGKKAKAEMDAKIKAAEKEIKKKQEKLIEMKEELEEEAMLLPATTLAEKEREYQNRLIEYQRIVEDYTAEIQRRDRELTELVISRTKEVLDKIGEEGRYTLILEKTNSSVLYYPQSIDLTDEVIRALKR
jgi:outer membrane protein